MGAPAGPGWAPTRVTNEGSRRALIGVVSVVAVVAAGFAVVNLRSADGAGASSPEAALDELVGAIGDEDLIGVLQEMAPAERDVMVSWFEGLESNLSELGVIEDVDLGGVSGFDLEVEGLESRVEEVMPGVSRVYVTGGELRAATEPDSVPVGEVLEDLIEANGGEVDIDQVSDEIDLGDVAEETVEDGGDPLFLAAVEQDGRWYLSLSYTIAEYARLDAGVDPPDPDDAVQPQGAASAEGAATEFLIATAALDVERMISLLPPDEMGALQDYAPLFLDDAQEEIEEMRAEDGFEASLEGLEVDTRAVEGGTRVIPRAGTLQFTTDEGDMTVSIEDGCVEATGELGDDLDDSYGTDVVCLDDLGEEIESELTDEERADLEELGGLFRDYQPGLVVVERDGQHFVSPLRTFSDLTLQVFDGVERADLEEGGILYRLFTGESVLTQSHDEETEEVDVGASDDGGFDDEFEDELPDDFGPDYDLGYGDGSGEGLADGSRDGLSGNYFGSYDDIPTDIPAGIDPTSYEAGYVDGYSLAYEEGYAATCDPATTPC